MSSRATEVGARGEEIVATHLQSLGATIIAKNWRIREGEIDIVARLEGELLFVEVKTRTSTRYGHPLEAIDREKAHRLQRLALAWIAMNDMWGANFRIDCAAVLLIDRLNPIIDYRAGVL